MTTSEAVAAASSLGELVQQVDALRPTYRDAAPWPHLALDGVFDWELVAAAEAEARQVDPARMLSLPTRRQLKRESADQAVLGPCTRRLLEQLNGPVWTSFLTRLTGIDDLQPDPALVSGGLHDTPSGGFTMVHVDQLRHPVDGRHHRVNTLLYLNAGWEDGWGGALELWPADMRALGRRIVPSAGRVVVWESGAHTPHGLPEPIAAPDGRSRLALAVYHYTEPPAGGLPRAPLSTFRRRPQDSWTTGLPTLHDLRAAVVPPGTRARVRRLLRG